MYGTSMCEWIKSESAFILLKLPRSCAPAFQPLDCCVRYPYAKLFQLYDGEIRSKNLYFCSPPSAFYNLKGRAAGRVFAYGILFDVRFLYNIRLGLAKITTCFRAWKRVFAENWRHLVVHVVEIYSGMKQKPPRGDLWKCRNVCFARSDYKRESWVANISETILWI